MTWLEQLTGSTDDQDVAAPKVQADFWGQLTGPTDESRRPAVSTHAADNAPHRDAFDFLRALTGATDGSDVGTTPKTEGRKPSSFDVVGVIATVAGEAMSDFRTAVAKQKAPATPTAPPSPANPIRAVITRDHFIKSQLEALAAIREWPHSPAFELPEVVRLRAEVQQFPIHLRLQAAQERVNMVSATLNVRQSYFERLKAVKHNKQELTKSPLSTARWTGTAQWQERVREQKRRKGDIGKGFLRYVAGRLIDAAAGYGKRVLDNGLAATAPHLKREGGKTHFTLGEDSHLDDQAIFNGTTLIFVNPTSKTDIQPVPIDTIDSTVDMGVEGAAMWQGVSALRSGATGARTPMLLFNRGYFVVRAKGKALEYVRVPMVDPSGFHQTLRQLIDACKTQPPQQQDNLPSVMPTVRDLLWFPEDDESWRWREERRQGRNTGISSEAGDAGSWSGSGGGEKGFTMGASSSSRPEDIDALKREIAELKRRLSRPGISAPESSALDNEDIVEGEFKEE